MVDCWEVINIYYAGGVGQGRRRGGQGEEGGRARGPRKKKGEGG